MLIIDEDNWRDHTGDGNGRLNADDPHAAGEARLLGCRPRITPVGALKFAAPPTFDRIPRSEWTSRAADQLAARADLRSLSTAVGIQCKDQASTNYCHAHSPALALEIVRATAGESHVELSPGSIGGPVTGYRNDGAAIEDDLRHIVEFGAAETRFVPTNQISRSGWKPGAAENALIHRCTHWWDLGRKDNEMFDRCATLLLQNIPICVGYNWWGHAVTLLALTTISPNKFGVIFRNSWGASYGENGYGILAEGKGTPDDAYAPRQATATP